MEEYKIRQEIYHRLKRDHPDAHDPNNVIMMHDTSDSAIIEQVVWYFSNIPPKVIYPAKSYFVAIVYSRLLRDHFNVDPMLALDDADLLHGNDPYFRCYSDCPHIYDAVLEQIGWEFDLTSGETPDVQNYFNSEFMIE